MKINQTYQDLELNEKSDHYTPEEPVVVPENSLYNFLFHYNNYTGLWSAIPRDKYNEYWSDHKTFGVVRSRSIQTLTELIQKTNGDISLIEQLVREQ